MEETPDIKQKIAEIEAELSTLDHRRSQLLEYWHACASSL
jgi:hypothetical protein